MDQKIAWYKEIIELEPSSKIFFPLARLLVRDGYHDHAIDVLRKGLGYHKDFFEARLMLIELLHNAGEMAACDAEVRILLAFFAEYPQFWNAWGSCLAHDGTHSDVSLAMRFIAASQQCSDISFASLIDKGLQLYENQGKAPAKDGHQECNDMALQDEVGIIAGDVFLRSPEMTDGPHISDTPTMPNMSDISDMSALPIMPDRPDISDTPVTPVISDTHEGVGVAAHDIEVVQALDYADFLLQAGHKPLADEPYVQDVDDAPANNVDVGVEKHVADLLAKHVVRDGSSTTSYDGLVDPYISPSFAPVVAMDDGYETDLCSDFCPDFCSVESYSEDEEGSEATTNNELFTLRTRSMAEVLLSQGDVQGALSIYGELLHHEKEASIRLELQECIDALRQNKNGADPLELVHEPCHGKEKLLQMLNLLAERLDSRAQ